MPEIDERTEKRLKQLEAKVFALEIALQSLFDAAESVAPELRTKMIEHLRFKQDASFRRRLDEIGAEIGRLLPSPE